MYNLVQWLIVVSIILANLPAEAQQQKPLTLACKGAVRMSSDKDTQDISMGIIFDFATSAVAGFDIFAGSLAIYYNAKITFANDVTIVFKGGDPDEPWSNTLDGTIDRVTGDLDATTTSLDGNMKEISWTRYVLHCTPTQRMF